MFRIDPDDQRFTSRLASRESAAIRPGPAGAWRRLRALVTEWRLRSRSRVELSSLDDRQLADIGLSRSQAGYESGKFFFLR